MSSRAPKQWLLSKDETINSFTNWKENLIYSLSLDTNFTSYLVDGTTWGKKTSANANRGFTDDAEDTPGRKTAVQKCAKLELMLGQVANYCTVISRNAIVKNSTSLNDIWSKIREHYGFQTTGSRFLDLYTIDLRVGERYEDLYQRILSFFDDNLLTVGSITHHGEDITTDEEMSPSMENVVVFLWLQRIHEGLPALIKQRYGADLRNKTLASIKPEISLALDSLLDELKSSNDARIMRSQMSTSKYNNNNNNKFKTSDFRKSKSKVCCLCRAANRSGYDTHYLSTCKFLPENDRKFISSRIRQVDTYDEEFQDEEEISQTYPDEQQNEDPYFDTNPSINRRVTTRPSPHMKCFHQHYPAMVCIDTGAESNLVSEQFAKFTRLQIKPTKQGAAQADGQTPLNTVGETTLSLTHGAHVFNLNALVIRNLGSDIIVGEPFLELNDIGVRSAKKQIIIKGRDIVPYSSSEQSSSPKTRRITTHLCRAPTKCTTILPGDYIELPIPHEVTGKTIAIEPRYDSQSNTAGSWPPVQITEVIGGHIHINNDTPEPILLKRNDHFCQIRSTIDINTEEIKQEPTPTTPIISSSNDTPLQEIEVDPDKQLSNYWRNQFSQLHEESKEVFRAVIGHYNDKSGTVRARVNIGKNTPPTRKLKVPCYSNSNLQDLQNKFDLLEKQGVFCRPEDLNITVEHVSPSFLVRKPSGGTRLVTAFTSVGQYSKILPSVMPTVDDTLRTIATWKYIITTDLKDSFYQIPLDKDSMKWCATPTPFRGLRIYLVASQGMPGSSEVLEELMCTVFGDMIKSGSLAKIADDLYVGGNTIEELYNNWVMVLRLMLENGLKFKASKTKIAPTQTTILGWIWNNGNIRAGSHRITPLATCKPPETVTKLRSFIGSYKVFNRLLRGCARQLSDLESAISGKQQSDKIDWNEQLLTSFKSAQSALSEIKSITLPTPKDQLILVHDGSQLGIGSVLYFIRDGQMKIGGYFSAKLKPNQSRWLPCEIEALSISTSVRHFAPYIRQSYHHTQILTDNRPCIQAYTKMKRGEFSTSARVATFLTNLSDYDVELHHIAGQYNLPSDFHSRNPVMCDSSSCQVCSYIAESETSAVRSVTADDIINGQKNLPYTNRQTWKTLQMECPDLRRVHAYLSQGTRPSTKNTKSTSVKRYLHQNVIISKDGLLVRRQITPFLPTRELIVVPQQLLKGFLTSIHIRFNHPPIFQLEKLFLRNFYALKLHDMVTNITAACSICQSLKTIPSELHKQSGTSPPPHPCMVYAFDILRRYKQFIFILRDTFSSYTVTQLLPNERHDTIREAIISGISYLRPSNQIPVVIRVDSASGIQALKEDIILTNLKITLEFGRIKNPNKNPVAEKCVRELGNELLHLNPDGGPITPSSLSVATSNLNSRIRNRGLSSWEIIHQRDQFSGTQLPFLDEELAETQAKLREDNRHSSSKYKSKGGHPAREANVHIGSLVYVKREGDKTKSRDKYIITNINDETCQIQKFTKDQLRSRRYEVKLTEIFPISSDILPDDKHLPLRGIEEESDSDGYDDNAPLIRTPEYAKLHSNENIYVNVDPLEREINNDYYDNINIQTETTSSIENQLTNMERPKRKKNPPSWMKSEIYELRTKKK